MISRGTSTILSLNSTKIVLLFFADTEKYGISFTVYFLPFLQNVVNAKFGQRHGHGKFSNS